MVDRQAQRESSHPPACKSHTASLEALADRLSGSWPAGKNGCKYVDIVGYRLRFNLDGRPRGKSAPANICPDERHEVWGVLYKITRRDLLRLDSTEGVPGGRYRPTWLNAEDVDGNSVTAVAYVAKGKETDGNPSLRYISLLREGARANGLPEQWIRHLDSVNHAE